MDPEKPFTGWRTSGQTKHIYTKSIVGVVGYGVNKTRYAAAMISKQVRCTKRCDQFVTASFKRCDACIYSSYLCNETRVSDNESHGFGNG